MENPYVSQIDFDKPEESLVINAIFWNSRSTEHRSFSNVFSSEQIIKMSESKEIWNWKNYNRSWIFNAVEAILEERELVCSFA